MRQDGARAPRPIVFDPLLEPAACGEGLEIVRRARGAVGVTQGSEEHLNILGDGLVVLGGALLAVQRCDEAAVVEHGDPAPYARSNGGDDAVEGSALTQLARDDGVRMLSPEGEQHMELAPELGDGERRTSGLR